MKKTLLSLFVSLLVCATGIAKEQTVIIDGAKLTSTATTADSELAFGDITIVLSKGAKATACSGTNKISSNAAILIGKKGTYIYNKTAIPGKITKFEIYANKGASKNVSVGVNFSAKAITAYDKSAENTFADSLKVADKVYDLSDKLPDGAKYFWYQVTNDNNSQVQFRITYEEDASAPVSAPGLPDSKTFLTESCPITITNNEEGATVYYTTDGSDPTTDSPNFTGASKQIMIVETSTVKAMAVKEGRTNSRIISAIYTYAVYKNLQELAASEVPAGQYVMVTLTKQSIKGKANNGIFFNVQKEEKDIELYYKPATVPSTWMIGGTVSGTVTGVWNYFSTGKVWEIVPDEGWAWTKLTYEEPSLIPPTLKFPVISTVEAGETVSYAVEYDGDGALSATSKDESVATAKVENGMLKITALKPGTSTITVTSAETGNYQSASYYRTVTVIEKLVPVAIPFSFDGGKAGVTRSNGMLSKGLGSDYNKSPKLKFDDKGDSLVICMAGAAEYLHFSIKGNGSNSTAWSGIFEVHESEDGVEFTVLKQYKALGDSIYETLKLSEDTRFVRFQYVKKSSGNVALGNIKIDNDASASIDAVTTTGPKSAARKSIVNGRIVIIQNGRMYSLTGQEIKE